MEYLNLIDYNIELKKIILIVFIISFIVSVTIINIVSEKISRETSEIVNFIFSIGIIWFFVFLLASTKLYIRNNINYKIETKKINVTFTSPYVINKDKDTFIVDGKVLEINKFPNIDIKYSKKDGNDSYIIVDEVTYEGKSKWYVTNRQIDEVNSTKRYILKEVHY